jgi:hypothetical protein
MFDIVGSVQLTNVIRKLYIKAFHAETGPSAPVTPASGFHCHRAVNMEGILEGL